MSLTRRSVEPDNSWVYELIGELSVELIYRIPDKVMHSMLIASAMVAALLPCLSLLN